MYLQATKVYFINNLNLPLLPMMAMLLQKTQTILDVSNYINKHLITV